MVMVVASGVTEDGRREIPGCDIGDSETEVFWQQFLASLRDRGLDGVGWSPPTPAAASTPPPTRPFCIHTGCRPPWRASTGTRGADAPGGSVIERRPLLATAAAEGPPQPPPLAVHGIRLMTGYTPICLRERGWQQTMSMPTPEQIKRSPAVYMRRVQDALRLRKQDENRWGECYAMYGDTAMPRNLIRPSVDLKLDTTLCDPPKFVLHPTPVAVIEPTSTATQRYSNTVWRRYNLFPEFQGAGRDCLICGHGWVRVLWQQETDRGTGETIASYPGLQKVDPFDMVVSPGATCMSDLQWIGHRRRQGLSDVMADDRYDEHVRQSIGVNASRESGVDAPITIWEMWSMEDDLFAVWAEGTDEWLIDPRQFPSTEHPFVLLEDFCAVPYSFYSPSNTSQLVSIQKAISEIAVTSSSEGETDKLMSILIKEFQIGSGEQSLRLLALSRSFEEAATECNRKIVEMAQHRLTKAEPVDADRDIVKTLQASAVSQDDLIAERDHLIWIEVEAGSMSTISNWTLEEGSQFLATIKPFVKMDIVKLDELHGLLKSKGIPNPEELLE